MAPLTWLCGFVAVALVGVGVALWRGLLRPPRRRPGPWVRTRAEAGDKVVVCLGDSLTHGSVSFDYVEHLAAQLEPEGFCLVNAGINGDLAYSLKARLPDVIACQPDIVTILVGTNDTRAASSEQMGRLTMKASRLPRLPTVTTFEEDLRHVVRVLKEKTFARIALVTLPVMGEDLNAEIDDHLAAHNDVISHVALAENLPCLPLHRELVAEVRAGVGAPRVHVRPGLGIVWVLFKALLQLQLFGLTLDEISHANGLRVTTDLIHLNTRGGMRLAALVEDFIRHGDS